MAQLTTFDIFSDFLTLDRYCRDRFIDFVPAVDVDVTVTSSQQLVQCRQKINDFLSCFDHPKYVRSGSGLLKEM